MSTTTSDIAAGAVVRWISSNTYKQGVVEAVVAAGRTPADVGFPKAGGGGIARDHESYIVRGRKITNRGDEYGPKALYWPHVSLLELQKPADVVAPKQEGWRPVGSCPHGEYVLFLFEGPFHDSECPGVSVGKLYNDCDIWLTACWAGTRPHDDPTHWMPLPSAPSQIEEGKDNG